MVWKSVEIEHADVANALVLVTAPSFGMVGPVAARFLIDELKLGLVNVVLNDDLPPSSLAWHGIVSGPIQFWHKVGSFGADGMRDSLLIANVDVPIPMALQPSLARFLLEFAAANRAESVLCIEGYPREQGTGSIRMATNLPGEVEGNRLKAEAVHGPIAGLGAALLLAGLEVGKSVTALYAPAVEETGDPEAAAEFLASVRPLVPHERIEPAALLKQTADIERRLREDRERAAREASRIEGEINRSYL